ncbi:MAG: hypothetical protein SWQ30_06625 [Thermodesulfobacteriota bacterium]|nr:hypothetical protein [Thermodesulfobacteriota bacterium]
MTEKVQALQGYNPTFEDGVFHTKRCQESLLLLVSLLKSDAVYGSEEIGHFCETVILDCIEDLSHALKGIAEGAPTDHSGA